MRRGFSWTLVLILFCALLGGAFVRRQAASVIGKGAADIIVAFEKMDVRERSGLRARILYR